MPPNTAPITLPKPGRKKVPIANPAAAPPEPTAALLI